MKNLFLLSAWLLFMPAALHAQLQKNNLLLEGSFAYSRSTPKYTTVTLPSGPNGQVPMDIVSQSLLLSPTAGLFLTDRLALSGGIIYSRSSHKQESPPVSLGPSTGFGTEYPRSNSHAVSNDIAPLLSLRYFYPLSDKIYFNARLGAAYHFTRSRLESNYYQGSNSGGYTINYAGNHLDLSLSPQLVYFLNRWLGLEAQLGGLSLITAQKDSRYPSDRQPGSSLDLSLAPSAWKFGLLFNLGGERN